MLQGTKFFKVDLVNVEDIFIPRDVHRDGNETDLLTELQIRRPFRAIRLRGSSFLSVDVNVQMSDVAMADSRTEDWRSFRVCPGIQNLVFASPKKRL